MGVRASDADADAFLRRLLADHVEPTIPAEHADYSFRLVRADRGDSVGQDLHSVHEGGCALAQHRRSGPVVEALLRHLDQHARASSDVPVLSVVAMRRRDGSVVLASVALRRWVATRQRWLASKGLEVLPTPVVEIDAESGDVIVPRLSIHIRAEDDGLAEVDLRGLRSPLRLPVHAWVLLSADGDFAPLGRAVAVERAVAALVDEGADGRPGALAAVAQVLRRARPVAAGGLHRPHVVDHLPELA